MTKIGHSKERYPRFFCCVCGGTPHTGRLIRTHAFVPQQGLQVLMYQVPPFPTLCRLLATGLTKRQSFHLGKIKKNRVPIREGFICHPALPVTHSQLPAPGRANQSAVFNISPEKGGGGTAAVVVAKARRGLKRLQPQNLGSVDR